MQSSSAEEGLAQGHQAPGFTHPCHKPSHYTVVPLVPAWRWGERDTGQGSCMNRYHPICTKCQSKNLREGGSGFPLLPQLLSVKHREEPRPCPGAPRLQLSSSTVSKDRVSPPWKGAPEQHSKHFLNARSKHHKTYTQLILSAWFMYFLNKSSQRPRIFSRS